MANPAQAMQQYAAHAARVASVVRPGPAPKPLQQVAPQQKGTLGHPHLTAQFEFAPGMLPKAGDGNRPVTLLATKPQGRRTA